MSLIILKTMNFSTVNMDPGPDSPESLDPDPDPLLDVMNRNGSETLETMGGGGLR